MEEVIEVVEDGVVENLVEGDRVEVEEIMIFEVWIEVCGAAAERLHLLRRPNGTLEPPRKESAACPAARLQAAWSRCGAFTTFLKAAKRHT